MTNNNANNSTIPLLHNTTWQTLIFICLLTFSFTFLVGCGFLFQLLLLFLPQTEDFIDTLSEASYCRSLISCSIFCWRVEVFSLWPLDLVLVLWHPFSVTLSVSSCCWQRFHSFVFWLWASSCWCVSWHKTLSSVVVLEISLGLKVGLKNASWKSCFEIVCIFIRSCLGVRQRGNQS